jgi:hypothetical protein
LTLLAASDTKRSRALFSYELGFDVVVFAKAKST